MRILPAICALALVSAALVRAEDPRRGPAIGTKTRFELKETHTLESWKNHASRMRRQILASTGLWSMPEKTPLNAKRFGTVEKGGVRVERVWLESRPGFFLAGNLYLPAKLEGRRPAVLIAHGHWKHGRTEDIEEYSVPRLGAGLAQLGYVAFAYDMLHYNDTQQLPHSFGKSSSEVLWAYNPLAVQLWNSVRALDFVASLAEVDPSRIAITGASGGGTQTYLLAAIDERIAASIPVVMVSATFQGDCRCEVSPSLRVGTNNVELAALAAPRPLLVISATGDWTKNVPRHEAPALKRVFALFGRENAFESVQFDVKHNYNRASREETYRFLKKHFLGGDNTPVPEPDYPGFTRSDLLILGQFPAPPGAATKETLYSRWIDDAKKRTAAMPAHELRERLATVLGIEEPGVVTEMPGQFVAAPGKRAALLVSPKGGAGVRKPEGVAVLALDAFQTGSARGPRDRGGRFFTTYNRTDDQYRVQDILNGIAFLRAKGYEQIDLVGEGRGAIWALFAHAVATDKRGLASKRPVGWSGSDVEFAEDFFVPGIQYAGGLDAALRLTGAR